MKLLLLTLAVLLAGCDSKLAAPPPAAESIPSLHDIATGYTQFHSMTKKPVYVDPGLAMLCRGASQADVDKARETEGPHAHTAVMIDMNDLAATAFQRSAVPYPAGSIIVKEKKGMAYWAADTRKRTSTPNGVGGMIKRQAGYDPQHGDWEYFYFEDPAKIESGPMSCCVQCHDGAAATDHVFGSWAPKTTRQ